jgi:hypothetical protein
MCHGYQKLELQIDCRTVDVRRATCEVSVRGLYIEFSEPVAPNLEAFHRPREQHRHPAGLRRSDRARKSAPPGPLDNFARRHHQPRHRLTPCQDPNRSKPPEDPPGSSNLLFSRATSASATTTQEQKQNIARQNRGWIRLTENTRQRRAHGHGDPLRMPLINCER